MTDDASIDERSAGSLADALEGVAPARRACQFCTYVDSLPDRDREALQRALRSRDRKFTDRVVAGLITDDGYSVSYSTISNHRNGTCIGQVPDWRQRRREMGRER